MKDQKHGPGKFWIVWSSPRANLPGSASASNQNILQKPSHEGSVSSSTHDPGGHLATSLAARNERQPAVRKCHIDCLSCLDLLHSLEVKSNITGRTFSSINVKSYLQNLRYTICRWKYYTSKFDNEYSSNRQKRFWTFY